MCGRYVSVKSRTDLVEMWDATAVGPELPVSYNVAPTSTVYGVVEHLDTDTGTVDRQVRDFRWGLVPSWAKDPKIGSRLVNARVETLSQKPSWRTAFRKHRAVVPASAYYEWRPHDQDGKVRKQPYYIHPAGDGILAFAGLYEMWRDPAKDDDDPDRWLWTTVIITTDATGPVGDIHDRTPLILPADRIDAWLDPKRTNPDHVYEILDGIVIEPLEVRPVSTRVNRVGNNGPELIEPLDLGHPDEPLQLTLTGHAA